MIESKTLPDEAIAALRAELGDVAVSTNVSDRLANSRGVWPTELKTMRRVLTEGGEVAMPGCVISPVTATQTATALRIAQQWRIPVVPFGGGSGIVGGTAAMPGSISLDTKRLSDLRIDEESMVANVGAGIFGADLERSLNDRGLSLGHFPQSLFSSTIGGWVATGASGTFSTLHGNIEDRVLGLEVALPGGDLLRTRESPRSSTGPDLAQWFIGSEGTLGVVTEVAVWLHPVRQDVVHRSFLFPSFQAGIAAIRNFMQAGARPGVVRLYDPGETSHKFREFRFCDGASILLLVFEGEPGIVKATVETVEHACAEGSDCGAEPVDHWWATRFETRGLVEANSREGGFADAIEVSAFWANLEHLYAGMMTVARKRELNAFAHVSHAYPSGASLYVIFSGSATDDATAIANYESVVGDLLSSCLQNGGSISHHHGIGRGKARWLESEHGEAGMKLLRAVKRAVDPYGIMNPGVLGLGA